MGYSIRRATLADAPSLTRCIEAAYAGYVEQGLELPPVSEGMAKEIRDNLVWVAVEGNLVLGGIILAVQGEAAHLRNVAVDPAHSGGGIGRALMDAAIAAARDAGHGTIRLATHKDIPRNVMLYRHLGWHVTGEEGNKVFMARSLMPDPD